MENTSMDNTQSDGRRAGDDPMRAQTGLPITPHAYLLEGSGDGRQGGGAGTNSSDTAQVTDPDLAPATSAPIHSDVVRDPRLAVSLPGLDLKNPVMTASGTCWYGQGIARDYDLDRLGAIVLKSTTLKPRAGNPTPRLFHSESGWMNCNGLHNVGVEREVGEKIPWLAGNYPDLPVVASVAGSSVDEYEQVVARLAQSDHVAAVELNVSCPNVKKGGATLGTDPQTVEELTRRCKAASRVPVYVKLTPNITSIVPIAQAAERGGADGLTMINTLTGLAIDPFTRRPLLSNVTGGVSGPAVKPVALRLIHEVRAVSDIPIIGVGGIRSAEDVLEFLMAGADAVQVGSAALDDPLALPRIIADLPVMMDRYGISSLAYLRDVR
jgi:dihydroorotate dehydrogenase (NAD+) catalytic subunit